MEDNALQRTSTRTIYTRANANEEKSKQRKKWKKSKRDRQMSTRSVQNNVSVDVHIEEENDHAEIMHRWLSWLSIGLPCGRS